MNRKPYKIFSTVQLIFFIFIALASISTLFVLSYILLDAIGIELAFLEPLKDIILEADFFVYGLAYPALDKLLGVLDLNTALNLLCIIAVFVIISVYAIRVIVYSIKAMRGKCDYYFQRQLIGNIFVVIFIGILIYNLTITLKSISDFPTIFIFNVFALLGVILNLVLKICGRRQTLKSFANLPPSPKMIASRSNEENLTLIKYEEEPSEDKVEQEIPIKKKRGRKPKDKNTKNKTKKELAEEKVVEEKTEKKKRGRKPKEIEIVEEQKDNKEELKAVEAEVKDQPEIVNIDNEIKEEPIIDGETEIKEEVQEILEVEKPKKTKTTKKPKKNNKK